VFALTALVGCLALSINLGNLEQQAGNVQNAADSAAVSGEQILASNLSSFLATSVTISPSMRNCPVSSSPEQKAGVEAYAWEGPCKSYGWLDGDYTYWTGDNPPAGAKAGGSCPPLCEGWWLIVSGNPGQGQIRDSDAFADATGDPDAWVCIDQYRSYCTQLQPVGVDAQTEWELGTASGANCGASTSGESRLAEAAFVATATPGSGAQNPVTNAVVGNTHSGRFTTGADQAPADDYIVDMGSTVKFNEIEMAVPDYANDYAHGYDVAVSSDGSNWTVVASCTGTGSTEIVTFPAQSDRYIEVVLTTANPSWWWSMEYFYVYTAIDGAQGSAAQNANPFLDATNVAQALVGETYGIGANWSGCASEAAAEDLYLVESWTGMLCSAYDVREVDNKMDVIFWVEVLSPTGPSFMSGDGVSVVRREAWASSGSGGLCSGTIATTENPGADGNC
jgi:hypothetical protein